MHTYIYAYINTYTHAHIHKYIHTFIQKDILGDLSEGNVLLTIWNWEELSRGIVWEGFVLQKCPTLYIRPYLYVFALVVAGPLSVTRYNRRFEIPKFNISKLYSRIFLPIDKFTFML